MWLFLGVHVTDGEAVKDGLRVGVPESVGVAVGLLVALTVGL